MNEYLNHFVAVRNTRASVALGDLALGVSRAAELINSVSRFCRLLCVCGTCCRRSCLVVTPWSLLRALWTCAYWGITLLFLFISAFFCCSMACLVSWFWDRSGLYRGIPFPDSMCQVIVIITFLVNWHGWIYENDGCLSICIVFQDIT